MNQKWRKILSALKRPRGWQMALTYLLTVIFCAGAITLAVINSDSVAVQIISYVLYALAAITLGYSVYTVVLFAGDIKRGVTDFICRFEFGRRMLAQYDFRTVMFATLSLMINIAFVAFHVVLAFITDSPFWYGSLALYYATLVFLRGIVVIYQRKKRCSGESDTLWQSVAEVNKYCTCGICLTVVPLFLAVPILQIIFLNKAFEHAGMSVIAFAAYAFYKIIMAIYNFFKAKKQADLTVEAVRNVGLADAFVSIFSLQTGLLFAFSDGADYSAFNIITGVAVCVLTVTLGVFMIIKSRRIKKQILQDNG